MATGLLNKLEQDILPTVVDKLQSAGIGELLDITSETTAKDERGATIKTVTTDYSNIPIPPLEKNLDGRRVVVGDKPIAYGNYKILVPKYKAGARIDLTAGMRLKVLARDTEPVKIFHIVEIFDGVMWEVEARKES